MSYSVVLLLAALPKTWLIDVSSVPDKPLTEYRLSMRITLIDGKSLDCDRIFSVHADSKTVAETFLIELKKLDNSAIEVKLENQIIRIRELRGPRIRTIAFTGSALKPLVQWEPLNAIRKSTPK